MKLSNKAVSVLKKLIKTEDCSMRLTKTFANGAQELKNLGLAEFIPHSQGWYYVALTSKGIDEANSRQLGME